MFYMNIFISMDSACMAIICLILHASVYSQGSIYRIVFFGEGRGGRGGCSIRVNTCHTRDDHVLIDACIVCMYVAG